MMPGDAVLRTGNPPTFPEKVDWVYGYLCLLWGDVADGG
jgi:hypothetical protein